MSWSRRDRTPGAFGKPNRRSRRPPHRCGRRATRRLVARRTFLESRSGPQRTWDPEGQKFARRRSLRFGRPIRPGTLRVCRHARDPQDARDHPASSGSVSNVAGQLHLTSSGVLLPVHIGEMKFHEVTDVQQAEDGAFEGSDGLPLLVMKYLWRVDQHRASGCLQFATSCGDNVLHPV